MGWLGSIQQVGAQITAYFQTDPDMGPFEDALSGMSREEFMTKRAEGIAMKRGIVEGQPFAIALTAALERDEAFPLQARLARRVLLGDVVDFALDGV